MNRYYSKKGKLLGRAWSLMSCHDVRHQKNHKPHVHDSELFSYGPYLCEGWPKREIYNQPKRKPINS